MTGCGHPAEHVHRPACASPGPADRGRGRQRFAPGAAHRPSRAPRRASPASAARATRGERPGPRPRSGRSSAPGPRSPRSRRRPAPPPGAAARGWSSRSSHRRARPRFPHAGGRRGPGSRRAPRTPSERPEGSTAAPPAARAAEGPWRARRSRHRDRLWGCPPPPRARARLWPARQPGGRPLGVRRHPSGSLATAARRRAEGDWSWGHYRTDVLTIKRPGIEIVTSGATSGRATVREGDPC